MLLTEPGLTAVNLVNGEGYTFNFYGTRPEAPLQAFTPPLHPWLIALALQFSNPALALALLQALLGTLTVWMLRLLATGILGQGLGSLVGWMGALYPAHILVTSQPISVALHACCLMAVLLASWRLKERPTPGRALLVGGLIGLFALSRPQILAFAPLIIGWLWLNELRGRQLWRMATTVGLTAVVVLVPWSVRNAVVLGWPLPTPTLDGVTFWNGNNPFTTGSGHDVDADKLAAYRGVERDPALPDVYEHPEPYPFPPEIEAELQAISELDLRRAFYRAGLDYIRQNPVDWVRLELRKLLSFWWFRPNLGANPLYRAHWTSLYRIQYALVLGLTGIGVVLSMRRGLGRLVALPLAVLVFTSLFQVLFEVLTRYRWEIELLMLIFVALSLEAVWRKVCEFRGAG
jgi:hypothetical protein